MNADLWSILGSAFKKAYVDGLKKKAIIGLVIAIVFVLLCTVIVTVILDVADKSYSADTDESMKTIGNDYVVNTAVSEAKFIITDKKVLIDAINSLNIPSKGKENLLGQVDKFLETQDKYKVNAVFSMAIPITESSAGTNWSAIDPSTYNWISIRSGSGWKNYSGYGEAIEDFADLIANRGPYFKNECYSVSSIGHVYCPNEPSHPNQAEGWINNTIKTMTDIYNAAGIDTSSVSITGNAIVDTAAKLYMQMYTENWGYNQSCHNYASLILENSYCADGYSGGKHLHTKLTDCSAFVCSVLRELGYNVSLNSKGLLNFDPAAYGLEGKCQVIHYNYTSITVNELKAGDIVAKDGHTNIVGKVENGYTYVYDAGTESNWRKHQGQMYADNSLWQEASHNRITIIRFIE